MSVGRLQHRADFLRVAGRGRKWVTPGLVLQVASMATAEAGSDEEGVRVGFTASRRVGNAVERNRVRRRLRAAVREVLACHGRRGRDYVGIGRRASLGRPFRSLVQDLKAALVRLDSFVEATGPDASGPGEAK